MYRKPRSFRVLTASLVLVFLLAMTGSTYAIDGAEPVGEVATASEQAQPSEAAAEAAAPQEPAVEEVSEPAPEEPKAEEPAAEENKAEEPATVEAEPPAPGRDADSGAKAEADHIEEHVIDEAEKEVVEIDDEEEGEDNDEGEDRVVTKTFVLNIGHARAGSHFWVTFTADGNAQTVHLSGNNPYTGSIELPYDTVLSDVTWYGGCEGMEFNLGTTEGEILHESSTNSYTYCSSASGVVFDDTDGDGEKEGGEGGLSGRTVTLMMHMGEGSAPFGEAVTDANGNYEFSCLPPTSYHIEVSAPEGWTKTTESPSFSVSNGTHAHHEHGQRGAESPEEPGECPCLEVDVTVDRPVVLSGDLVNYTYKISNSGDKVITNVQLVDDQLGLIGAPIDCLYPGQVMYRTAAANIYYDLTSVATVRGMYGEGEGAFPIVNSDSVSVNMVAPAVELELAASPSQLQGAGTVTYTYTIRNAGDTVLDHFVLTDTVIGDVPGDGERTLAPGESFQLTAEAQLTTTTTNVANVVAHDEFDNSVTDTAEALVTVLPAAEFNQPDLAVGLTANDGELVPGQRFTYTVTYRNVGEANAEDFDLALDYDERYIRVLDASGATDSDGVLTWNVAGPLSPEDGEQSVTFSVEVIAGMPAGDTVVDAVAMVDDAEDPNDANDAAAFRVVVSNPFLSFTEDDDADTIPFLPFTGGGFAWLLGASAAAAATGSFLRRRSRKAA